MNFPEIMVKWGTLIWPGFILLLNMIGSFILSKYNKSLIKIQAEIALERLFSCSEGIIVNESFQKQTEHSKKQTNEEENELIVNKKSQERENSVIFVNSKSNNDYYYKNNRIVQLLFAGYYNTFLTYFGYFCIQTFFMTEQFSNLCMEDFICEPIKENVTCQAALNRTSSKTDKNFLCSKYEIESSFDAIMLDLAVAKTVFAFLVEANMFIYELVRKIHKRNKHDECYCEIKCCLSDWWLLFLIMFSLSFIFLFWMAIPFVIFQIENFLPVTRSMVSKLVSILATCLVVVFMAFVMNMIDNKKTHNYLVYMES